MAGLKLFSESDWSAVRERARPKSASLMKHSELRRMLLGWGGGEAGKKRERDHMKMKNENEF